MDTETGKIIDGPTTTKQKISDMQQKISTRQLLISSPKILVTVYTKALSGTSKRAYKTLLLKFMLSKEH